jgi:hypothetical protein
MKKALKIIGIVFLSLFLLLLILPFFFKGTIVKKINEAANSSLNAKFEVNDFSLSLLRSFPNFSLGVNGLSLSGVGAFEKDTLANIPNIYVTIDLMSVFKGDNYEVKSITITNPHFMLKALKDGKVNWDIMKPSKDTSKSAASASKFKMTLQKVKIVNGRFIYDDAGLNMVMKLEGLTSELHGDMTADLTSLNTNTTIEALTVDYGGVRYLNKTKAELTSDLEADLKNMKFTFKTGDILLNTLPLKVTGWFSMPSKGYDFDMKFNAPNTEFKNFLSLIPAIYSKNFKDLKSSGILSINGFVKGHYSESSMPGFGADIKIEKGMFQYPSLPTAVNNVNLKASILNPSGVPDATIIDVSALHFQVLNNAMDVKMHVKTPVSDPHITGSAKGKLNLADLRKVYPMEQTAQLSGKIDMDVQMDGKLSSIEKGRYQEFKAAGFMLVEDLKYGGKEVPKPVDVRYARLDFSPSALNLSKAEMKIGSSDLMANGKIENYIGYFFNKGKLKGTLTTSSDLLNIDELMSSPVTSTTAKTSAPMSVVAIPENIDLVMNASVKKLIYSKIDIQNVNGNVIVGDGKANLNNLKMNMLNGDMVVNGSYDTRDPKKPIVDFDLNITAFDIQKAAANFTSLTAFAPIAQKVAGLFSSKLKFRTDLGTDMMPVLTSVTSSGSIITNLLRIENVNTLGKLSTALKIDKLKNFLVDKLNLSFEVVKGKLFVKPFDFTTLGIKANLGGSTSLDKSIDYALALEIPRKEFGGAANSVLNNMVSQVNKKGANFSLGETVRVNVLIGGTLTNPILKTGLKEAMGNVAEDLKLKALAELTKKKEEVAGNAINDANMKAQALIDQANKQADAIMNDAKALAEKAKAEANTQIDKLTADADKNGPIASFAAKRVGDRLKKEADNNSNQIITEAQKRCDDIMGQARQKAEGIKKDAGSKAGIK